MGGQSLPWSPGLIDVPSRFAERPLTIQSASLAGNQFTTSFLRHATRAKGSVGPAARVGTGGGRAGGGAGAAELHFRKASYTKRQLARCVRPVF